MIKFFRHIRQSLIMENRTSKYIKYAIGEIVLVVIGILIALQINNWNESYKSKLREIEILKNFVQDLRSDSISYSVNYKLLVDISNLHQQLYQIGIKNIDTISLENSNNIRRLPYYNPIAKENDPQIASKISNDSIRKAILNYFRAMKDLDDSYGEFENVIQQRMRIFLSNKNLHDLSGWFESKKRLNYIDGVPKEIIKPNDLIKLSKNPEFQQLLLEASLKCNESQLTIESLMELNSKLITLIEKTLKH